MPLASVEEGDDPVLDIGGRVWDLSNLCPQGDAPVTPPNTRHARTCHRTRQRIPEPSLYPSLDVLDSPLFDCESAEEAFRRAPLRSSSPPDEPLERRESLPGAFHRHPGDDEGALPGAFPATTAAPLKTKPKSKPPLPSWVDSPTGGDKKPAILNQPPLLQPQVSFTDYSDRSTAPTEPPSEEFSLSSLSLHRMYSDRSARTNEEDENEYYQSSVASSSTKDNYPTRAEIEVAPGKYMPLRGSAETMNAIQTGKSTTTICFACQATLKCVSDADLVICPDCRVLSPLSDNNDTKPADDDDKVAWEFNQSMPPSYTGGRWMNDGMSSSRQSWNARERFRIGGVGLGLKVDPR